MIISNNENKHIKSVEVNLQCNGLTKGMEVYNISNGFDNIKNLLRKLAQQRIVKNEAARVKLRKLVNIKIFRLQTRYLIRNNCHCFLLRSQMLIQKPNHLNVTSITEFVTNI